MSDVERCIAFLRDHIRRIARTAPSRLGTTVLHPDLPNVWSLNYLLAERELDTVSARALAEEADKVLGAEGLQHRKIEVLDGNAGRRLADEFGPIGWHVEHDLVMPHRRSPDRQTELSDVEEASVETLVPSWTEGMRADFAGKEDVIRQLVEHKRVLAAHGARFFAARTGGTIAAYCDLYSDGQTAQIEAVMTLERFRNRGFARAVVSAALAAARSDGHDLVFLLADDADWPKKLYGKLGFDAEGDVYEFTLRAPPPSEGR